MELETWSDDHFCFFLIDYYPWRNLQTVVAGPSILIIDATVGWEPCATNDKDEIRMYQNDIQLTN